MVVPLMAEHPLQKIQKNTFNPTSGNSEILIIRHLWREIPRPEGLFLHTNSFTYKPGRPQGHVQNATKSVHISTVVISPDPVSYSINFLSYEDSRKHRL
jgi:hypothetical protein